MSAELPIPPAVANEPRAGEVVRVWAGGSGQYISLNPMLWDDPAIWGMSLADLAANIAAAYAQCGRQDPADTMLRIKAGFDAEWGHPTDVPKGGFMRWFRK